MLQRLATLAALEFKKTDEAALEQDIHDILNFVDQLRAVDTSNVLAMSHPLAHKQPLREDRVTEQSHSSELADIAPHFENHCYQVPVVIDQGQ